MANNANDPQLSDEARQLIVAARGFDDPTAEDRERVRTRWLASIAAGAGLSALGTAARAGGGVGWGMKAAGVIAALTVGGLAFYTLMPSPPPAPEMPQAPVLPPEPARVAEVAAPAAPELPARELASPPAPIESAPSMAPPAVEAPAPRASAVQARPAAKAPALPAVAAAPAAPEASAPEAMPAPSSQLSEELAVIAEVRRSVQGGDGASALNALADYQARFAAPILGMEAAALRVDALCQAGQQAAARAEAAEFEKAWPASPLRRRVAASCR